MTSSKKIDARAAERLLTPKDSKKEGLERFQMLRVEEETEEEETAQKMVSDVPRNRLMRGIGRGRGPQEIVTLLGGSYSTSINKNAATGVTITITTSAINGWSSYAGLYDEVTLIGGDFWCNYDSTGMASTVAIVLAFAWDPVDGATPGSGNNLICMRDKFGPVMIPTGGSLTAGSGTSFPMMQGSTTGMFHLPFAPSKMSKSALGRRPELSVSQLTPVNCWLSVNTSNLNFGYLKMYATNPNAAVVGSFGVTVRLKVAFRLRNG